MRPSLILRLFFTIWVIYLFHFNPNNYNSTRFVYLTMSLSERGSIRIDDYPNTDIMFHRGHYYIETNPGLSFMATPSWAIVYHLIYRWLPKTFFISQETIPALLSFHNLVVAPHTGAWIETCSLD